jgi:hypothetical protein
MHRPVAATAFERVILLNEVVQDIGAPGDRPSSFFDPTLIGISAGGWGALNLGSFARGLEVGVTRFDGRRSSYTATGVRRQGGMLQYTSVQVETSQRLISTGVAMMAMRMMWPDHPEEDNLLFIPTLGVDHYLPGGWSFVAFRVIFDPRRQAGTVFRVVARAATATMHLQADMSPRTDGVVNFGVQARWRYLLAGYSYDRDFDFSRFDRGVFSVGLQVDFGEP